MRDLKLRLLHVVQPTVGGVWRHVQNLALGLDRDRFEVAVACPPAWECDEEELTRRGVTLHRVRMRRSPDPPGDLRALLHLVRLARDYDLVHTHSSKAGFLGRLAARLACRPVTLYTPNAFAFLSGSRAAPLYFALERLAAPFTDALIACSPSEARTAARLLPQERIHLIPNAVDIESLHPVSLSAAGPTIGMVARLVPQKAPEVFVRAFARVRGARPGARALVIGDGEQRAAVEALARQLGIGDAIQFLGHRHDVPELLRGMDLVVLTSRYEGLPYCLLEAMACGLPVVATRAPGTVDIVEDGITGLLVPLDAPEAVAAAILCLLDAPERARAMGESGRRRVAERFALPVMLAAHERLYQELLEKRCTSELTRA